MPQEIVRDEGLFPFERVHLERLLLAADVILELSGEGPINDVLEVELREFRERVQLTLLRLHSSPSAWKSAARLLAEISSATGRGTMATLGRFGQSLAFPTFAHDPPLSLCVVRTPIAAIIVVALLLAGIAGCEAKPATDGMPGPASQRADTAPSIAWPGCARIGGPVGQCRAWLGAGSGLDDYTREERQAGVELRSPLPGRSGGRQVHPVHLGGHRDGGCRAATGDAVRLVWRQAASALRARAQPVGSGRPRADDRVEPADG